MSGFGEMAAFFIFHMFSHILWNYVSLSQQKLKQLTSFPDKVEAPNLDIIRERDPPKLSQSFRGVKFWVGLV